MRRFLLLFALAPTLALAQASVSTGGSYLEARLIVGAARDGGTRDAGLVLRVTPGWKTYWRRPGEAGLAPVLDWSASANLAEVAVAWPRPIAFESFGATVLGYEGEVVLPLTLTPERPGAPIALALDASIGVCREICLLEEAALSREIAPDAPGRDAAVIDIARYTVPGSGETTGVSLDACRIEGAGEVRRLGATLALPPGAAEPTVVLEGPPGTRVEAPRLTREGEGRYALDAELRVEDGAWVDRSALVTTVFAGPVAAEIAGCAAG